MVALCFLRCSKISLQKIRTCYQNNSFVEFNWILGDTFWYFLNKNFYIFCFLSILNAQVIIILAKWAEMGYGVSIKSNGSLLKPHKTLSQVLETSLVIRLPVNLGSKLTIMQWLTLGKLGSKSWLRGSQKLPTFSAEVSHAKESHSLTKTARTRTSFEESPAMLRI